MRRKRVKDGSTVVKSVGPNYKVTRETRDRRKDVKVHPLNYVEFDDRLF